MGIELNVQKFHEAETWAMFTFDVNALQNTATIATHCNMLQHVATHCNSLKHVATHCNTPGIAREVSAQTWELLEYSIQPTATHGNTLERTVTECNTLQHTATDCNTLQYIVTDCNTLQHTATHCNTLQHTATHCNRQCAGAREGDAQVGPTAIGVFDSRHGGVRHVRRKLFGNRRGPLLHRQKSISTRLPAVHRRRIPTIYLRRSFFLLPPDITRFLPRYFVPRYFWFFDSFVTYFVCRWSKGGLPGRYCRGGMWSGGARSAGSAVVWRWRLYLLDWWVRHAWQYSTVCCIVLHCVALCCVVLQCLVGYCSVL